ncbi:acylphosphatase [Haemophilus parahaemolyticus HK385]|uniref:acylphosphatase n=1 Tax=Haemophilus parahaemolyticus HK385 TaxID=1095744 RepID=A0ABN0EY01_HAEPH|nr:putative acylphosphatase [Haemophilus parahaemolyticus HK385]STO65534.1 acylphosphatase [Haemophilus parahaemolyticus HK385]
MITKQFFVFGRVQGVGFRFFTLQQAGKLGLKGTVRNRIDGSVEVIAQGTEDQISLNASLACRWAENGNGRKSG